MRYAAVTLLLVVLTPFAVSAQSPDQNRAGVEIDPIYIRGSSVTYILPEAWEYPSLRGKGMVGYMTRYGLLQRTINYPSGELDETGEEKNVTAQIMLSAVENKPVTRTFKEISSLQQPQPPDFFITLSDTFNGDNWRTLVTKGTLQGRPYVGLRLSGLVGKQIVYLSVTLLTDGHDSEALKQAVADFNALCESLKIDGKKQLDTKLDADKLLELLKPGEKKGK